MHGEQNGKNLYMYVFRTIHIVNTISLEQY